jgi:hypothetical protein
MSNTIEMLAAALVADPEKASAFFDGALSAERIREAYPIERMTTLLHGLEARGVLKRELLRNGV